MHGRDSTLGGGRQLEGVVESRDGGLYKYMEKRPHVHFGAELRLVESKRPSIASIPGTKSLEGLASGFM